MASYAFYAVGALGLWAAVSQYPFHQTHRTCDELASLLDGRVFTSQAPAYMTTADEVSTVIVTLARAHRKQGERFSIRSQGHMPHAGAANIQDGVTIDLRASWGEVYEVLDAVNITVTGGRASSIGAGGFLSGGGLSALGPAAGWGCDNVLEFKIVLASGEIVNITKISHPDLFIALKGGSNYFGVIAKFTMKAYPSRGVWGSVVAYTPSEILAQIKAYSSFMQPDTFDPMQIQSRAMDGLLSTECC
ncbi:uncharacterized protein BDV17DRAFT_286727 [Aspergillus undulatus]|uniref:uncharacterized protein n=1 Tax=Aspergillus undulatus TaxID=1810928 RepID=UPI003CCD58EE